MISPKYLFIPSDYKIYRSSDGNISFNVNESDRQFYIDWFFYIQKNIKEAVYRKVENKVTMLIKTGNNYHAFILSNLQPITIEFGEDKLNVTLMYDRYNTISDDYLNEVLSQVRKDKISELL